MKKLLEKIRRKLPIVRMFFAIVLALVCTGLVSTFWIWTLAVSKAPKSGDKAPSPWSAFTQSIKATVKNSDFKSSESSQTQVIDAGAPSSVNDETNPYQDSAKNNP